MDTWSEKKKKTLAIKLTQKNVNKYLVNILYNINEVYGVDFTLKMVNLATIIFKMGNQMLNNDSDDDNHDDED